MAAVWHRPLRHSHTKLSTKAPTNASCSSSMALPEPMATQSDYQNAHLFPRQSTCSKSPNLLRLATFANGEIFHKTLEGQKLTCSCLEEAKIQLLTAQSPTISISQGIQSQISAHFDNARGTWTSPSLGMSSSHSDPALSIRAVYQALPSEYRLRESENSIRKSLKWESTHPSIGMYHLPSTRCKCDLGTIPGISGVRECWAVQVAAFKSQ
jgi:hypothetical protein